VINNTQFGAVRGCCQVPWKGPDGYLWSSLGGQSGGWPPLGGMAGPTGRHRLVKGRGEGRELLEAGGNGQGRRGGLE